MYNQTRQMRCDFIRGKSQKEMDDMLPLYARIIASVCPCEETEFPKRFDSELAKQLKDASAKTLANHRTEIAGSLLGLYYKENGQIFESDRNKKFLQDSDQPALFKDVCFKHQFPTGVQKIVTVWEKVRNGVCFRPYPFILSVLQLAESSNLFLTTQDVGFYILNASDVLQGHATPSEVCAAIMSDRKNGIVRKITADGKASSYTFQHIREQLNYLELANLIFVDSTGVVRINHLEQATVDAFVATLKEPLFFDFTRFDLDSPDGRRVAQAAWDKYYGELSTPALGGIFVTSASAIVHAPPQDGEEVHGNETSSTTELGDEGESIVFKYEKARVKAYSSRLANRVLALGKTRGLGYDIQSVVAESGEEAEFSKYIEVKTTKRVTMPSIDDASWFDNFTLTRNEYLAAAQHLKFYSVFRVYFTRHGVAFYVIGNIVQKAKEGKIEVVPLTYRVDFSNKSIDSVIQEQEIQEQINA